ncbi:hypothetical protein, partial [Acidiphilium sp.]|uniref:hypothetical protein n=1 Tax=Acidiphilium sp. TaxID=527 RepID=UPI00258CAB6A
MRALRLEPVLLGHPARRRGGRARLHLRARLGLLRLEPVWLRRPALRRGWRGRSRLHLRLLRLEPVLL